MIKAYGKERLPWIAFFFVQQVFILFVSFVDPTIPLASVLYVALLSLLGFLVFLIGRYRKETVFYKHIQWLDKSSLDRPSLPIPDTPFEHITAAHIEHQTAHYRQKLTHNQLELEQEKDDLLSWVHEVKTPMTAMHLMIDRLKDDKEKEQLLFEWLRIHLLLDQQLHRKRLPFIENDVYIEKTALAPVVFHEIKSLQSWCFQKGIGFDVELSSEEVLTDVKWLGFILRQLLTNAIKYSDAGDIVIRSFKQNGRTVVHITDFGCGIAAHDMPRVFEKGFTSTKAAHSQQNGATGMGLYLAEKAARSLHIELGIQSEINTGTTASLVFPKPNDISKLSGM